MNIEIAGLIKFVVFSFHINCVAIIAFNRLLHIKL